MSNLTKISLVPIPLILEANSSFVVEEVGATSREDEEVSEVQVTGTTTKISHQIVPLPKVRPIPQGDPPTRELIPQPSSSQAPAGNLARYYDKWSSIISNSFILNIVEFGFKIQLNISYNQLNLPNIISIPSKLKRNALAGEIKSNLESGFISIIDINGDFIASRVFTVPKNSGGHRLIIDLTRINNFINKVKFRMEDKQTIKSLIEPQDYLVSIDLFSAFHSIHLHPDSKKLVSFIFEGVAYSFNVLPFGLTSSPRIFSNY